MKTTEALENHICRFNDGEQSCECFMAGQEAGKQEAIARLKERLKEERRKKVFQRLFSVLEHL